MDEADTYIVIRYGPPESTHRWISSLPASVIDSTYQKLLPWPVDNLHNKITDLALVCHLPTAMSTLLQTLHEYHT